MEKKEVLECIEMGDEGAYLDVKVSTESSSTEITGVNLWRNQLTVSIKEKAVRGEANKALIQLFAESLDISKKRINIVRGKTTKMKRMYFDSIDKSRLVDEIERRSGGH